MEHGKAEKLTSLFVLSVFFLESTAFAHVRALPRPAAEPSPPPAVEPLSALASPPPSPFVPLGAWSQEGEPGAGLWELSPDGFAVRQLGAFGPTFFVSPDAHRNVVVRGRLYVDAVARGGLLGLVVGYRSPLASEWHDASELDLILIDWSARASGPTEGFTLSRIDAGAGRLGDPRATTVLASHRRTGSGYRAARWYSFEVSLGAGRLRFSVDGASLFDVRGSFPEGRVGFFTRSQGGVTFRDVTLEPKPNEPPVASAGVDQRVDASGAECVASVLLDGAGSTDADGDELAYEWSGAFGTATGARSNVTLGPGIHDVTLSVSDFRHDAAIDTLRVTVSEKLCTTTPSSAAATAAADAEPPALVASVATELLWPPSHGLVDVGLRVVARAGLAPHVAIYSDEAEDEKGSGNQSPDAFLSSSRLELRSERSGKGNGRVYLIVARWESSVSCTSVVVPHDQSASSKASVREEARRAVEHCEETGGAPPGYFLLADGDFGPSPATSALRPLVECVLEFPDGGRYRAYFGYENESAVGVTVEVGTENHFAPVPIDRGQTTEFLPGRSPHDGKAAFAVDFAGGELVWTLKGPDGAIRSATASPSTARCSEFKKVVRAFDDEAMTPKNTDVVIPVLANDFDPEGDPLSILRFTPPGHGIAAILGNGVLYTPEAGFVGVDTFTYTATDGVGTSLANVRVTVEETAVNQAPVVNAGDDQTIELPQDTVTLSGSATDDGLPPGSTLTFLWTDVDGKGVVFSDPTSLSTAATFPAPDDYRLRLTATDGELDGSDDVVVTVLPPPQVTISVGDVTVVEGNAGMTEALVPLTVSSPFHNGITVEFLTEGGTATPMCDYVTGIGLLRLEPGEAGKLVRLFVAGELAEEADETFEVRIGNELGALLGRDRGVVTIENDDGANAAPSGLSNRTPGNGATGLPLNPLLEWTASDPEGDAITFDVYYGTAFDVSGQAWQRHCPVLAPPAARAAAASAFDEANDRLIVFSGDVGGGAPEPEELWILSDATAAGGVPSWALVATSGGPVGRREATSVYDPSTNRMILQGGCSGDCDAAFSDTWLLKEANGLGGAPEWMSLPDLPVARRGAGAAYDPASNRMILFGGSRGSSDDVLGDVWILKDANGEGTPEWEALHPAGAAPEPRQGASVAYDPGANRLLVFGGRGAFDSVWNDVWVLENANGLGGAPSWRKLEPSGLPPAPRWGHAGVYDATSRRLLVFGGAGAGFETGENAVANDSWILTGADGSGPSEWIPLAPANVAPERRYFASAAYSSLSNRLVVAFGADNRSEVPLLDDLWILRDAMGSLPLVSADQTESSYAASTPAASADYFWRVVVRDAKGAEAGSPVWRFSPNEAPVVDAGGDQRIALPSVAVLDATVTDDGLPGTPLSFEWSVVSGPGTVTFADPNAEDTTASFDTPGVYVLRLTVGDGERESSHDVTVTVDPENQAPVVDAGADQSITLPVTATTLSATVTDDGFPFGSTLTVLWTQVEGTGTAVFASPASASTSVSFDVPGVYRLRITGSDGERSNADDVFVTLIQPNQPPVVNAGADQATNIPAASVTLSGTASDDGLPSNVLNVGWSVVSGPGSVVFQEPTALVTTATFDAPGLYVLHLTASDTDLAVTDDASVIVGSPSSPPDLTVETVDASAIFVDPQTLEMSGTAAAVIRNQGVGPAAGPFEVTFFEDRNGNGTLELLEDNVIAVGSHVGVDTGATAVVAADVLPTSARFRGSLIHAFVDSGEVIAETDETNNYGSSAAVCDFRPLPTDWSVELEWSWTSSPVLSAMVHVLMTPVVIDLDRDGFPEIIFTSHSPAGGFENGHLRVLDGRDGSERFTVTDESFDLHMVSQIAVGDIDGDAFPEIVAVGENAELIAFEHDGTFKWRSIRLEHPGWGGPAIADLEGDGVPEIVSGRQVLNNDGTLRWTGTGGKGSVFKGNLSVVADVDMAGPAEVVAGNTVYRADGSIFWRNATLPDGINAVGNLDDDPFPEIVLVVNAKIWLLEHTGEIKWGPIPFPELPRMGGLPIIADFDGDGEAEIGVPDRIRYYLFERDGTIKWQIPIEENSDGNGSSAFDFDGDGAAELVYSDARTVRIHRGSDGVLLFRTEIGNVTAYESAIVADVDGDGNVEVIAVGSSGGLVTPARPGVFVFGDANDHWAQSRKIWNQITYHITNVNDDGTIPDDEANSWETLNSYRANAFGSVNGNEFTPGCAVAKPDLTASFLRIDTEGTDRVLTARIGNGGAAVAGAAIPVSFYDGDPARGGKRLGTARTTSLLAPGAFEDVALRLPLDRTTERSVWVVADDVGGLKGRVSESDESNNAFDSRRALLGTAGAGLPDLVVTLVDASGVRGDGQTLEITGDVSAEIANQGEGPALGTFQVLFFEDRNGNGAFDTGVDNVLGSGDALDLAPGGATFVPGPVSGALVFGGNVIHAFVDAADAVFEANENNNLGRSGDACSFAPPTGPFTLKTEWAWSNSPIQPTARNVASTPAVVDLNQDGIPDVVFATFIGGSFTRAYLRAVNGRDGQELFSIQATGQLVHGTTHIAVGDIDGDGRPEIVAGHDSQNKLIAFEDDGTFKWLSPVLDSLGAGAPSLVDLDGDGLGEVVLGRQVLNSNGTLRWTGSGTSRGGSGIAGSTTTVVDLDLDGRPEVVTGNIAYDMAGNVFWSNPALSDGLTAIGNFDSDPFPEIVHVSSSNNVHLIEHTGQIRWGPVRVQGSGIAGPPTLADVDGDGRPEIAIAVRDLLNVLETSGFTRWIAPITHTASVSNYGAGSSAFDFDGDNRSDLVYADETGIHLFRGTDGAVLAETLLPTCNLGRGYPVVVDVDGDGQAEIVAGLNDACAASDSQGLVTVGEAQGKWIAARKIWNQYAYHVTNVHDDGTLPSSESSSDDKGYREQERGAGFRFSAADLTASFVRRGEDGTDLLFTVRIGNGGVADVAASVPVSVYNGDPRLGFPLLDTVQTTRDLAPGEHEDVVFRISSFTRAEESLHFSVDDSGGLVSTVKECDEENNLHDSGFFLNRPPTLSVDGERYTAFPDPKITVSATFSDDGLPLQRGLTLTWGGIGPNDVPVLFDDRRAPTTTARFLAVGLHHVGAQLTDGALLVSKSFTVTVDGVNRPPTVDAGPDRIAELPAATASLLGVVADDGQPTNRTLTTSWSLVSGPGPVSFADPSSPATTATFSKAGDYVLRLTADDGAATASDDVAVKVTPPNQAPSVDAGADQTLFSPSVILAGTAQDDGLPMGSALTTTWSVVSAPGVVLFDDARALGTRARFGMAGVYVLRLTATDGALSASDDVSFTVDVSNVAPIVDAGADQSLPVGSTGTTLSGSVSDDGLPLGSVVSVGWGLLSGPSPVTFGSRFSLITTVSFTAAGTYRFRLDATDGDLLSSDTVEVFVDDGNRAPVANAGADQSIALPVQETTLAGSASDDGLPAGSVLSFSWSQVSGPSLVSFTPPNAAVTTARFEQAGSYVLRLSATDGRATGVDDVAVTVLPAPPGPPPFVEITSPEERSAVTDFTDVIGTVRSDSLLSWRLEYRKQGTSNTGEFTRFASGTTGVENGVLGTLDPSLLRNGLYEVKLTATDEGGQSRATNVFVVVKDNLKIGHFTVSFVDVEVPVSGLPIRVTRTYDSRDKRKGDFGFGWTLDLKTVEVSENGILGLNWAAQRVLGGLGAYCLTPLRPPVVTVSMPDGQTFEFEPTIAPVYAGGSFGECQILPITDANINFKARPGTNARLEAAEGNFVFVYASAWPGTAQLLDGRTFQPYDPSLYRLILPDGREFTVHEKEGLKSVKDLNGNTLMVSPTGITHSSGTGVVFERDPEGRIRSIADPDGNRMFYEYDGAGDLVRFRDREDNRTTFTYLSSVPHHLDGIDDPRGVTPIRNEYDPATGRLVKHTDAFGNTIEYLHDVGARQEVILDRNGKQRVLEYDTRGNVVLETDPLGKIVRRTFDGRNNRLSETEPHEPGTLDPPTTHFTYDSRDNLTSQTDPEGNRTEFRYNSRDQVERTVDALQNETRNFYDGKGNLERTVDALGNEARFAYDSSGNVKTQTVTVGGIPQVTEFTYDASGNLKKEIDPGGNETSFTYDRSGNRLTETRTRTLPDNSVETLLTKFEYDKLGRLVRTTEPDGTSTRTVYDALGKQKETFDQLGRKTTFEYDLMGQLAKITYPDQTTEEFTYDKEGRRLSSKDRGGRTTSFEYDDVGRLRKTTFPDGAFTENVYDSAGRLVESIDARRKSTRFEYDSAGRRTKVIDPIENETKFFYDKNGNQTGIEDPKRKLTEFRYDALNRRIKTEFPDRTFTETGYDELGRRVSETDQAGVVTGFEYDKLGRLTKVIQDVSGFALETTYAYDEVGNRISQTDASQHTTRFEYDELGRETKRILPDGMFETKAYDAAGNLVTWTKFDGSIIRYEYDFDNRLTLKDFPAGTDVRFTYTPTGRRETVTDARGLTTYGYDRRDRLTALIYPDGRRLDYGYDENGSRTSLTATIGSTILETTYSYDDASRLDVVTDPNGLTYDHGYDSNGNRQSLAYPNGTSTTYEYDDLNRLTDLTTTGPGGIIQSYQFTLGLAGNRTQIDEADGTRRAYEYDDLYRLTKETITNTLGLVYQKSFEYDDVGNRRNQTTTGLGAAVVDYGYDTRDRLLTENLTNYGWDDNGNLRTKSGEATYFWDFEDRLVRVEKTDGTVVTHAYDADGNRVRTEVTPSTGPPEVTNFLVDTSGSLSHVVAETNESGSFVAYYVRGDDLLSVIRPADQRFYHADGLGSIRVLTDTLGNVTDSYVYTAFGEQLAHVGTDIQPYQFAGESFDPNAGFYYNRARWMNRNHGRFTTTDPFEGLPTEPVTLHHYIYAGNDPVNKVDPTGKLLGPTVSNVGLQTNLTVTAATSARTAIMIHRVLASVALVVVAASAATPVFTVGGALEEIKRRRTPTGLYAFGNRARPRGPRLSDFKVVIEGAVGPEFPPTPDGASTFADPNAAPLKGHYHRLMSGLTLPVGLAVIADGEDVGGPHARTHHTIYPTIRMDFSTFLALFLGLPWEYAGNKAAP